MLHEDILRRGRVYDRPRHWDPPKLTVEQRNGIRSRLEHGATITELAVEYGVSRSTIKRYS